MRAFASCLLLLLSYLEIRSGKKVFSMGKARRILCLCFHGFDPPRAEDENTFWNVRNWASISFRYSLQVKERAENKLFVHESDLSRPSIALFRTSLSALRSLARTLSKKAPRDRFWMPAPKKSLAQRFGGKRLEADRGISDWRADRTRKQGEREARGRRRTSRPRCSENAKEAQGANAEKK